MLAKNRQGFFRDFLTGPKNSVNSNSTPEKNHEALMASFHIFEAMYKIGQRTTHHLTLTAWAYPHSYGDNSRRNWPASNAFTRFLTPVDQTR